MSNKQTKKNYQKPNTQKKQYEDVPAFKALLNIMGVK